MIDTRTRVWYRGTAVNVRGQNAWEKCASGHITLAQRGAQGGNTRVAVDGVHWERGERKLATARATRTGPGFPRIVAILVKVAIETIGNSRKDTVGHGDAGWRHSRSSRRPCTTSTNTRPSSAWKVRPGSSGRPAPG